MDLCPIRITAAAANSAFHLLHHFHHYALYLLSFSLRSPSLLQQHLAYATLLTLFTSDTQPLVSTAFLLLSADTQLYLTPFQLEGVNRRAHRTDDDSSRVMTIRQEMSCTPDEDATVTAVMSTIDERESGFSPSLWAVEGRGYSEWLTRLVSQALRTCVRDTVLQRLKELALFDAAVAVKLLPLTVMDVVGSSGSGPHRTTRRRNEHCH